MNAGRDRLEAEHHRLVLALGHRHFLRALVARVVQPVQPHEAVDLARVAQLDPQRKFAAHEDFFLRQNQARERDVGIGRGERADAMHVHARAGPRIPHPDRRLVPLDLLRVGEDVDFKPRRRAVLKHRHRPLEGLLDRPGRLGFLDARHRAEQLALLFFVRGQPGRQRHVRIIHEQHDRHGILLALAADQCLRGLDGHLHLRFVAARDARHRTRVVDHDHLCHAARGADAVPHRSQQREQQEENEQRAEQQHQPLLHLPPRAQARADALEKHQRRERPLPLPDAQEEMEDHRGRDQRQQPGEQRIEQDEVHRGVATPSWPGRGSRRRFPPWC